MKVDDVIRFRKEWMEKYSPEIKKKYNHLNPENQHLLVSSFFDVLIAAGGLSVSGKSTYVNLLGFPLLLGSFSYQRPHYRRQN